jgi:thiosulfate/3-mercaptopyruvate sulfurtransferase
MLHMVYRAPISAFGLGVACSWSAARVALLFFAACFTLVVLPCYGNQKSTPEVNFRRDAMTNDIMMNFDPAITAKGYIRSEVLVSTQWVADNLTNPAIRLVETNEDILLYGMGHIPNAIHIDWQGDLNDRLRRDYLDRKAFGELLSKHGVSNDTVVIFYGDKNNWWAAYAFWVFQLFGHTNAKLMDGGRAKWIAESRPLTKDMPTYVHTDYVAKERADYKHRAFRDQVNVHSQGGQPMIDVRSPKEFSGELLHMENYPNEGALRGGHIPGAKNVPWATAANADGTFKAAAELREIYEQGAKLSADDNVITYCRIGERSSHTWFVLHYLLGYPNVRNYDGSWTEWGNLVGAPIER